MEPMETMNYKGLVVAELYEDGKLVDRRVCENFVTDAGLKWAADQLKATPFWGGLDYIQVGTGTGQTRASTGLATHNHSELMDATYPDVTASPVDNVLVCKATLEVGDAVANLTEGCIAVGSAATPTVMYNYWNFVPPIDKSNTQEFVITMSITCGSLSS